MSVLALLDRASQVSGAVVEFVLKEHGITRGELAVLEAVVAGEVAPSGGIAPSDLAERAGVTRAGMTKRLDRLEQAGLVSRVPSSVDRRSVAIRPTDAGRRLLPGATAARDRAEARLLARLSPSELAGLEAALHRLLAD